MDYAQTDGVTRSPDANDAAPAAPSPASPSTILANGGSSFRAPSAPPGLAPRPGFAPPRGPGPAGRRRGVRAYDENTGQWITEELSEYEDDNWDAESHQSDTGSHQSDAASHQPATGSNQPAAGSHHPNPDFVPPLAIRSLQWLDPQKDDHILDIGCGDGLITQLIAEKLTDGYILGIDKSSAMIDLAISPAYFKNTPFSQLRYRLFDAVWLADCVDWEEQRAEERARAGVLETDIIDLAPGAYTKIFSTACFHWILGHLRRKELFFVALYKLLEPGGTLVFEMGGHGNIAELHAALISAVASRRGIAFARRPDVNPWFFPDAAWMVGALNSAGFLIDNMEMEDRPMRVETGPRRGIEGLVRVMGKSFIRAMYPAEETFVKGVCEVLESVCTREDGTQWMGYVGLRVKAKKPL